MSATIVASDAVQIEWQRRVPAEYAVSALAQDLALRLTMFGAPSTLIEQALTMALDELAHAADAASVAAAAGATGTPVFDPAAFAFESDDDPVFNILVAVVPSLCLGETLALRIVHHMRDVARVPAARVALDRIVRDEPRHAALGWQILDWLLDTEYEERVHLFVGRELPRWTESLRRSFAGEHAAPHLAGITEADREWGLAYVDDVREIFAVTVVRDWEPRLGRRGFTAAA